MSRKTSRHHVRPRSRFREGEDKHLNNTVEWDERFHQRFHMLFADLELHEIHEMIDIISMPNTRWDAWQLRKLREKLKKETEDERTRLSLLHAQDNDHARK